VLTSTLENVAKKIRSLEDERRNLMLEIEELKKIAESRTKALETEIGMLREQVRALRMLVGAGEPEPETDPNKKSLRK
jgi:uncharacterized protein YaaN involved in tellurite resistance